jgi:hypothetical protein
MSGAVFRTIQQSPVGNTARERLNRREFVRFCGLGLAASPWAFAAAGAQRPAAEIWGPTVLPQPFEREPFREVRLPAWVQQLTGVGYTLSGQDREQRARAARAGVAISELGFVDPYYPYYDSRLLHRRSPHVPLDRLKRDVAQYKELGIRVLAVYPPSLQGEVYEHHPDWRRVAGDTREIPQVDLAKYPHGGMLCLLGPYGDFLIEILVEILTLFPEVDAFSFDGLHYGGVCYCGHCREAYRRDLQAELPPADMEQAGFRRYQHWADRRLEELVRRMQFRLKGLKPDVALITWTTNAGRFGHFLDIPRNMPARMNLLLDAPDMELWLDETNRGATVAPALGCAYLWAVTNHRVGFAEPYLMSRGAPYGKDSFPPHEIERRMLLALTHGAGPSIAVGQPPHLQPTIYRCLGEVQRRKPWLTHKAPEPWAALLMSDNTRCFYGRSPGQVEQRYLAHVFGAFRALLEEHLPFTLINDWNLAEADLASYRVLVLPNTACLDAAQVQAIRHFVSRGGGLVASADTSLCDEFGTPRRQPQLLDVFGVARSGLAAPAGGPGGLDANFTPTLPAEYWEKCKGVWNFEFARESFLDTALLRALLGTEPVTFKGSAIRVTIASPSAQAIATLHPKPESSGVALPALVTHPFGKGRVVYFPAGLDAAYYLCSYPYQRLVLRHAVEWAAQDPPPVRVAAPMCVHAVTVRQKRNGERLVVHLYNDADTTAGHGLPAEEVPLREEVLPIHDIRVSFRNYAIARAHLEPEGTALPLRATAEHLEVVVPRLDIHTMVVAELK